MKQFSDLMNTLFFQPRYAEKKATIKNFLQQNKDPDRGYALSILAEELSFQHAKPNLIKKIILERFDPYLFELSYDYVGDLSETVALLWPTKNLVSSLPSLTEIIHSLQTLPKEQLADYMSSILDITDYKERWSFLKLITGSLRVGVSSRFIKNTLAEYGNVPPAEIDEIWPQTLPPYTELLAWLENKGPKPAIIHYCFRPFMLSHPIDNDELQKLEVTNFLAEWKWDGVRVQAIGGSKPGLFSRTGDDVLKSFLELKPFLQELNAILDGELLIRYSDKRFGNFNALQQRLNRRTVTKKIIEQYPAWIRCYDLLFLEQEDLRHLPLIERRKRLEQVIAMLPPASPLDISPLIAFDSIEQLASLRHHSEQNLEPCEGIMLKHKQSPYLAGRKKGHWFKWKREPYLIDAVLMYAQRGSGKRSSFYSDYTFGLWDEKQLQLLPVGKAYFGFTDTELKLLDKWVKRHVIAKFGPVRQVEAKLVLEIAFEDIRYSTRHKSGIALRFPRIHRIRWDKPAEEADQLATLLSLVRSKNS